MFEVQIIQGIQLMRNAFFDWIFSAVTVLGDEMFFIAVAMLLFWCVDKRFGFKLINVYLLGCCVVEGVKNVVARRRPYTYDGVESVTEPTGGYSFPSGHSHSISNLSTQISLQYRKKRVWIPAVVLCVVIAFSRLYLGQHFLSDVIVGLALGVVLASVFSMLFELLGDKEERIAYGVVPVCIIVLIMLCACGLQGSASNVFKVLGGYSAVTIGYYFEKKYVRLNVEAKWYVQLIKIAIGIVLTLGVKEGLKYVFPKDIVVLYGFLRYFLTGLVGTIGSCAVFKFLKLENRVCDKDSDKN